MSKAMQSQVVANSISEREITTDDLLLMQQGTLRSDLIGDNDLA